MHRILRLRICPAFLYVPTIFCGSAAFLSRLLGCSVTSDSLDRKAKSRTKLGVDPMMKVHYYLLHTLMSSPNMLLRFLLRWVLPALRQRPDRPVRKRGNMLVFRGGRRLSHLLTWDMACKKRRCWFSLNDMCNGEDCGPNWIDFYWWLMACKWLCQF